jgi:hypothetical protein
MGRGGRSGVRRGDAAGSHRDIEGEDGIIAPVGGRVRQIKAGRWGAVARYQVSDPRGATLRAHACDLDVLKRGCGAGCQSPHCGEVVARDLGIHEHRVAAGIEPTGNCSSMRADVDLKRAVQQTSLRSARRIPWSNKMAR